MKPTLPVPQAGARQRRHAYTMQDFRDTKEHYTEGWLKGPAMAKRLGVPYKSFKGFVKRNPPLQKRRVRELDKT